MNQSNLPAFSSDQPILLCLTTLRHRRFVEDVINISGLPSGAIIRLRYSRPYVSDSVYNIVDCEDLLNMRALISLGASSASGVSKIVPVRRGRVMRAVQQGQLLVLDIALDDFIFESYPHGHFWGEIQRKAFGLPNDFRSTVRAPGYYVNVVRGPIGSLLAGRSVEAWEAVARRVLELDDLMHESIPCIPFLYLISGISNQAQRTLDKSGELVVDSGSRLGFDLHSLTRSNGKILRNPLGEVIFDISHSSATFATSRRLRVDSSRDVKRIQMFGSSIFRRARGHLSLRLVAFRGSASESALDVTTKQDRVEVVLARYDFPLTVGRWRPIVASASLALSSAALAWSAPKDGEPVLTTFLVPAIVGVLAFSALALGFWKEGSR